MDFKGTFKAFHANNEKIGDPKDLKADMVVAFCTPTMDGNAHISREHVWSHTSQNVKYVMNVVGENTYLDYGRNRIVTIAKEVAVEKYGRLPDYYLWLDQDNVFPPTLFMDLWRHNKDIVSGNYIRKNSFDWCFKPTAEYKDWENRKDSLKDGLIECKWTGFGACLIKGAVFEKMDVPWFKQDTRWIKHDGKPQFHEVGEDVYFGEKATEAGYKTWLDVNCHIGHQGAVVWPEDAYNMHKLKQRAGHLGYLKKINAKDPTLFKKDGD